MSAAPSLDPCDIVVFGGTGDLAMRKLLPALYLRDRDGHLAGQTRIIAVSRAGLDAAGYRDKVRAELRGFLPKDCHDTASEERFLARLNHLTVDIAGQDRWLDLVTALSEDPQAVRVFYLACAPSLFGSVCAKLAESRLVTEQSRVVLEKPIGHDLASARAINDEVGAVFSEEQIFRIDHYLGKETVQNLMVFRFANSIFEPLWNRHYIDNVQITAAEVVGVEGRGGYYDSAGAMRDMIQSHILQLMAALAMEAPNSFHAADLRTEQRKVLEAVRDIPPGKVNDYAVRGQYGPGEINGRPYVAYRKEKGVDPNSNTDTYAAIRLRVDNWRWQGVPFYLRTGKGMKRKLTQMVLYFKPTPHCLFAGTTDPDAAHCDLRPNRLVINVQPDEGISLRFEGKVPGQKLEVRSAIMDFDYQAQFGGHIPEAYGHLLLDAMKGDRSLFKDRHEIEAAWRIVMPVLDYWASHPGEQMHEYPAGSWGPEASEQLFRGNGHWHNPEGELTRWKKIG